MAGIWINIGPIANIQFYQRQECLFDFIHLSMLKYQSANGKHSPSSPQVDLLFSMAKLTATPNHPRLPSEKEQINSIRTMGKYLLHEETDSTVTFEEKGYADSGGQGRSEQRKEQGLTIYERGQLSERKKLEKIVNAHKAEAQRIIQLSKMSGNTLNATKVNTINKSKGPQAHPSTYRTKDSFMIKQLLKKCIKEEEQIHALKEREKKLSTCQTKSYLNQTTKGRYYQAKKGKRTATKQELQMIFEEVNQRSVELKKRKETTVKRHQDQKYEREMEGVTFHPHLYSSKSLRNSNTQGFLRRLDNDHKSRQRQKLQILTEQLRRDSFEPKLNSQRNSLSRSKVHSFRVENSAFFTARSRPELAFEKNLSRFIYPEEDSLGESKVTQSMEVAMKASDLKFLFE